MITLELGKKYIHPTWFDDGLIITITKIEKIGKNGSVIRYHYDTDDERDGQVKKFMHGSMFYDALQPYEEKKMTEKFEVGKRYCAIASNGRKHSIRITNIEGNRYWFTHTDPNGSNTSDYFQIHSWYYDNLIPEEEDNIMSKKFYTITRQRKGDGVLYFMQSVHPTKTEAMEKAKQYAQDCPDFRFYVSEALAEIYADGVTINTL